MEVTCVFYGPLRDATGAKTVVMASEGETVGALLRRLAGSYPDLADRLFEDDGELAEHLVVTLNRTHIHHLDDLATPVADGDTLRLTPAFVGG